MKRKYNVIIACSKNWFLRDKKVQKFLKEKNVFLIENKNKLTLKYLSKIKPKYIFFPHWSFIIKKNILNKYTCICFHSTALPFGRGGSPIQNLIKRDFKNTKICALKMENKIDAGPIYLKENLNLNGNLSEIFEKISIKVLIMINKICKKKIRPKKQTGEPLYFKRLEIKDNLIDFNKDLKKIFNQIRMLDDPLYPKSFINVGKYKIKFFNAKIKNKMIRVNAEIGKN